MSTNGNDKLETWKEIANYVGRDLRTVMRWEKERSLPVHCIPGGGRRAVFAFRSEIDAWLRGSRQLPAGASLRFPQASRPPGSLRSAASRTEPQIPASNRPARPLENQVAGSSSTRKRTIPRFKWAGLLVLAVMSAIAVILLASRGPHAEGATAAVTPMIPAGIEAWVQITLVNSQPQGMSGPFQQAIAVDSSRYASLEAPNLQNVAFFDARGEILKSWMESGNANLSSHTVYWIQLPEGIRESKSVNIYMGFAPKDRTLFNASTTGEAPGLSPTYGEFDNGALVFPRYADFRGSSLPAGWYSGLTPGGRGEIRIGNGVFIAHSGRGGGSAFLGSDWQVGSNIAEMDLLSQQTTRGQEMLFVCSSSPRYFHWTPDSVGYQDMSGLEIEDNNSGTPSVRATATPNPARSAVIGFHDGTLFANYQPVASVQTRICGGDYLATTVNTGFDASFSFDWIRMRVRPPNGVMPATIFGELNSGVTRTLNAEK